MKELRKLLQEARDNAAYLPSGEVVLQLDGALWMAQTHEVLEAAKEASEEGLLGVIYAEYKDMCGYSPCIRWEAEGHPGVGTKLYAATAYDRDTDE